MTYYRTVTSKGQVTIPAAIRKRLNIKAGQLVPFSIDKKGNAVIEPVPDIEAIREANRRFMKDRGLKPVTDEQIDEIMAEAAIKRYKRSLP